MECGLNQPDSGEIARPGSVQHSLHEFPAYTRILGGWINGNRSNARNGIALVKTVAAGDPSILFRNHAIEAGMREYPPQNVHPYAGCWNVRRKIVIRADFVEGVVAYLSTDLRIFGRRGSDNHTVRQCTKHTE